MGVKEIVQININTLDRKTPTNANGANRESDKSTKDTRRTIDNNSSLPHEVPPLHRKTPSQPPCRKYNNLDFRILRKTLEKQHNEGDSRSTCLTKTALPPVTQLFHIYTNHSQLPPISPTIQVLPPKRRGRRSPRKTGIKQNTFPIFGTQNQWPFKINKVIRPSVMTAQKLFRLRNQNFEFL